ncbi:MAG: hypothetical protein II837_08475 [Treponema sp.]|nr:hypothetical protein [Treponema sp.]
MSTIELTDEEVNYLFGVVMADQSGKGERDSLARKLTEALRERMNGQNKQNHA